MQTQIFRALYYERVSTVHDSQESSLENQRKLCESYLAKHPEIVLVEPIETYSEKISGKSDLRPKYVELINRLAVGDIDLLLVKDLKRLSRSMEVSAQLKNECKRYGFRLLLLESGQIYDPNAENNRMLYGFEALINEEVVHRQSMYGRIAHKQKMDAKRLNRQNVTFGYRWDYNKNDMVICEEEAEVVREIFDMVAFKDQGILEIKRELSKRGIQVCANTIMNWLQETAYIGCFHMNKKGSELGVGAGQKTKQFRNPKEKWVAVKRPDLAIVEPTIFELVQRIREKRKIVYATEENKPNQARYRGTHLFAAKVFCAECGSSYVHYWCNRDKTISAYKDSRKFKRKSGPAECNNEDYNKIYEVDLEKIALTAINGFIQEHEQCFELLMEVIRKVISSNGKENSEQKHLNKQLNRLENEAEKLLNLYLEATGAIKIGLAEKYEKVMGKIEQLQQNVEAERGAKSKEEVLLERIENIRSRTEELRHIEKLDRSIVEHFINRIEISKTGDITVILNADAMYKERIKTWKERKQTSKEKSAFLGENIQIQYHYDVQFYLFAVKLFAQGMTAR